MAALGPSGAWRSSEPASIMMPYLRQKSVREGEQKQRCSHHARSGSGHCVHRAVQPDATGGRRPYTYTRDQKEALARILTSTAPWYILGVKPSAPQEECLKAYKTVSLLVHPDRCRHPRSNEAFQKVAGAVDWVRDKNMWLSSQKDRLEAEARSQRWNRRVAQGGYIRLWE